MEEKVEEKKQRKKNIHLILQYDKLLTKWFNMQTKNTKSVKNLIYFFTEKYGFHDISKIDSVIDNEETILNKRIEILENKVDKILFLLENKITNLENVQTIEEIKETKKKLENFNSRETKQEIFEKKEENIPQKEIAKKENKINKAMLDSLLD